MRPIVQLTGRLLAGLLLAAALWCPAQGRVHPTDHARPAVAVVSVVDSEVAPPSGAIEEPVSGPVVSVWEPVCDTCVSPLGERAPPRR